jgi:glycosyltransferase involved in cell wall biosynthesis
MTLRQVAKAAHRRGDALRIVASLGSADGDLPPTVTDLPHVFEFKLPYYETYTLRVPSVLRALRMIDDFQPDAIVVSTPGPVGLLGLGIGRLLGVPVHMIYHSDFGEQVKHIASDESISDLVESLNRWVYGLADEVLVPTEEYRGVLEQRGYRLKSSDVFRRGIDLETFAPTYGASQLLRARFGFDSAPVLLYVGRVSHEKGIGFLLDVYERLLEKGAVANLLVVGDGPYRAELEERTRGMERCVVAGAVDNAELPNIYAGSDLLVFPSTTETFGMVVLEAHACALPAAVSDVGGPQEIVVDGVTGRVLPAGDETAWVDAIREVLASLKCDLASHDLMRQAARRRAAEYDWNAVLDRLMDRQPNPAPSAETPSAAVPAPLVATP